MKKTLFHLAHVIIFAAIVSIIPGCKNMDMLTKNDSEFSVESAKSPEKIEDMKKTESEIQGLIIEADAALDNGDFSLAEQLYNETLSVEPNNLRAQEGLRRVTIFQKHEATIKEAHGLMGKSDLDEKHAAYLLRKVLVEDPDNAQAASLYKSIIDKAEAERIEQMRKELDYKNSVSLEFRDTPLKIIIEALAQGTGVNFILDKDVKSNLKASLFVHDMSLESAVDLLLQSNQLKKKIIDKNTLIIYPDTALKARQYQDMILRSFFLEYGDPTVVSNLLKSMLGIKQIQTDDRLPMIMIKDQPEVMVLAEKLIKSQDIAEPEVMLEMEIMEVRRSAVTDLGVDWPTQLTVLSEGTLTLDALKNLSSSDIGLSPTLSVIFDGKDANANLLANPRIRVTNRKKATIHIGDKEPIISSNVSSNGVISDNVQYIDTGIKLQVEPDISMGGDVTIILSLEVSSISGVVTTSTGAAVPQIGTRKADTVLRLKDGETQILAGLISDADRENVDKVVGLGDIPGLGWLFSKQKDEKGKLELMFSITPHIVRARTSPDAALAEYWIGPENQKGRAQSRPKRTREEISKLFRAGTAPGSVKPTAPAAKEDSGPQGLNIPLPQGMRSQF